MEPERTFPPPSFPTSLNVFYKTSPRNFQEKTSKLCKHHGERDERSKQLVLQHRFPLLEVYAHRSSVSPMRHRPDYLSSTEQMQQKVRSISPLSKAKRFIPCNHQEAKQISLRKVHGFTGCPYDEPRELSYKEHQDSVKRRVNGDFKIASNSKYLSDPKSYLNSLNTFETFRSDTKNPQTSFSFFTKASSPRHN